MKKCISPARLAAILDGAIPVAPHVRTLAGATRFGVSLCIVPQAVKKFQAASKPTIFVIGDDTDKSVGPDGFHLPSIQRAIRSCAAFSVISCDALTTAYACPAMVAMTLRLNAMIVETQLEHEADWYHLIEKYAPGAPILLATVKGGRA